MKEILAVCLFLILIMIGSLILLFTTFGLVYLGINIIEEIIDVIGDKLDEKRTNADNN